MKNLRDQKHRKTVVRAIRLSRRGMLRTTAGLIAASAVGGPLLLGGRNARAAGKLYFASYGGSYGEALDAVMFKPFARETGIEVVQTAPATIAKLKASIATGNVEWDIIDWLQADVQTAANEGLLQPIDYSAVNAEDIIYPISRQPHSVSMFIYTSGIGYDTKRHPEGKHPTTWLEFWDVKKFPGRRGLRTRPQDTLEIGLLGAGVEPKKVYPLDVDLAFKSLKEIKPHITRWVETAPQTVDLLQKNELDFSNTLNGRVFAANKAGFQLGFSQKQVFIFFAPLCIPKGARNPKDAMKLLSYMMDPERQTAICERTGFLPMKKKALGMASNTLRQWFPDFDNPNHLTANSEWWGAPGRLENILARFKEFLLT